MRTPRTALVAGLATLVAVGMTAAPAGASASTGQSVDGQTTISVVAKNVVTVEGAFSLADWLTVAVDVPDEYIKTNGVAARTTWSLTVTPRDADNCFPWESMPVDKNGAPFYSDRQGVRVPLAGQGVEPVDENYFYYWPSLKCVVDVTVVATRAGDADHAQYDATATTAVSFYVRSHSTASLSAPTTVGKNKAFTVAGTAVYERPNAAFNYRTMPVGSKVAIQFRPAGSATWTALTTATTGTSGKFSAAVSVPRSGSLRAVVLATTQVVAGASTPRAVTAK